MPKSTTILTAYLIIVASGCSQAPRAAVSGGMVAEQVRGLAGLVSESEVVWPGFDLRNHVLIAAVIPDGPTFVLGDSTLSPESEWIDASQLLAIRGGPPSPELFGLRVAMPWKGRDRIATSFPVADPQLVPSLTAVLVHEAFHTHQRRRSAESRQAYVNRGNACFPDSSVRAVAMLNLEGHLLAEALGATSEEKARESATSALSVRRLRCEELGPEECARQRAIEQVEGSAAYVEAALTRQSARFGSEWPDSLRANLSPITLRDDLIRGHYYHSGHAWLLILERFEVESWTERVEIVPADVLLAAELGLDAREAWAPIANRALQEPAWQTATVQAEAAFNAWSNPSLRFLRWLRRAESGSSLKPGCAPSRQAQVHSDPPGRAG